MTLTEKMAKLAAAAEIAAQEQAAADAEAAAEERAKQEAKRAAWQEKLNRIGDRLSTENTAAHREAMEKEIAEATAGIRAKYERMDSTIRNERPITESWREMLAKMKE